MRHTLPKDTDPFGYPDDPEFGKSFAKGLLVGLLAAMGIVVCLLAIGLVAYYGQKYNW
jgi:hypothetical protein